MKVKQVIEFLKDMDPEADFIVWNNFEELAYSVNVLESGEIEDNLVVYAIEGGEYVL